MGLPLQPCDDLDVLAARRDRVLAAWRAGRLDRDVVDAALAALVSFDVSGAARRWRLDGDDVVLVVSSRVGDRVVAREPVVRRSRRRRRPGVAATVAVVVFAVVAAVTVAAYWASLAGT